MPHVILDEEEAWSFMTLISAQVLDQVELSESGEAAIREWRSGLVEGTDGMAAFAVALNEALGSTVDEELTRTIRRRDYYRKSR